MNTPALPEPVRAHFAALGIDPAWPQRRALPFCPEATGLVPVVAGDGRQASPVTATAWAAMHAAAAADGITLQVASAFRSIARQAELIRAKLEAGESIDAALTVLAAPGYSEHHTGRALDLATPGSPPMEEAFERTPAFDWLVAHAGRFGFGLSYPRGNAAGYIYEPWHWYLRERTPA